VDFHQSSRSRLGEVLNASMDIDTLACVIQRLPPTTSRTTELEAALRIGVGYGRASYPSQKDHWLDWLATYNEPGFCNRQNLSVRSARVVYQRICCAPMLFWLADASNYRRDRLSRSFDRVVAAGPNSVRQSAAFRAEIGFDALSRHLTQVYEP